MERRDFLIIGAAGLIGMAIKPALADDDNSYETNIEPTAIPTLSPTRTPEPTSTPTPTATEMPYPTPTPEEIWTAEAKITSYCLRGRTASGLYVGPGVVATDPRYIPLGSSLNIEGLGEGYLAADTGSGVRGWHIDVWSSDCNWSINWGSRIRRVLVTRWGWP